MPPLKSILVMADRSTDALAALQKAAVLARHFDAKIDLLACDAEQHWTARTSGRPDEAARAAAARGLDSRRFLEALRSTVSADDMQIRVVEDCEVPLHEGLPRKVRADGHNLVVKRIARADGHRRAPLTPSDWQVIHACPVPLMLTRGRPWRPQPRFVANMLADAAVGGDVVGIAKYLADGCHGAFEVVGGARAAAPERRTNGVHGPRAAQSWVDHGYSGLEDLAVPGEIDVVVLRACGARPADDAGAHALTERIVETLDCDVLLMPREPLAS